jgi:predicted RNA binding protein YcfA (HicA-like mRNA interferase family)
LLVFYASKMERDSKRIIKRLLAEGFERVSVKGSHHKFRKGSRVVVVSHPKRDLPLGTARSVAFMAGWLEKGTKQ